MNKEIKILIFITIGRTGSNYLFNLLDNCSLFNNTYELFHNDCIYALDENLPEYMQYVDKEYKDICDDELINDVNESPELLINFFKDIVEDSEEKEFLTFKIFPEHLRFEKIKKILCRDDVEVFFLKRSPIDSYISELKARISGKWQNHDHTNIKLSLYLKNYIEWYTTKEKWYKDVENLLNKNNKSLTILYYENFTKSSDIENLEYILSYILDGEINRYAVDSIEMNKTMRKQDKTTKIEERVENWDEFYSIVKVLGWDGKLFPHINE